MKMNLTNKILSEIEAFKPIEGNWLPLEQLLDRFWKSGNPELGIRSLLEVFEKYPNEDGSGVFWSILHGLETLDYEEELYNSLRRTPSEMGVIMLLRIENSGTEFIANKSIGELKKHIKNNSKTDLDLFNEL